MLKKRLKYLTLFLPAITLLIAGICSGQNRNFSQFLNAFNQKSYNQAYLELKQIDTAAITTYDKAIWLFYFADYNFKLDNHHLAYSYSLKAKELFLSLGKDKDVSDCNYQAISILSHQNNLNDKDFKIKELINEEFKKVKQQKDSLGLIKIYRNLGARFIHNNNGTEAIKYFKNIINIAKKNKDTLQIAYAYDNIGTAFQNTNLNNVDSAVYYSQKATPYYLKYKDYKSLAYNYNNRGQQQKKIGNLNEAINLYLKADSIPIKDYKAKTKVIFYNNLADAYAKNKDFENAFIYLEKLNTLKDSINDTKQNIEISRIKEQYDNEKLRADNLEIESKRKRNRNLAIAALAIILFGGTTALLVQKNTRKKQRLAEKEKALESQKLATVLKEQELISIDAMIEGQEKERQRIANDLHDDLGGLMATVKLHFNVLKNKQTPELFDKTTTLLDEAYQKIRSIAHAKNSGVIAKQGLLKAVQNMASTVSVSNKITIDVVDHGLENRLENSLELTIFRIIQELVTNIIKHAQATEATIHLTNHDDMLNIMVEDNGKGFNPKQITKTNSGMGISSIDKRIEHLNGKMTIESDRNQGTTIIIDIPV
ncbi:tetratricopeptide repeat-containing sensor histidine kinase [Neotamlana sedimentorum]|uniref:tetratricopeptide repeat-containing sensor histidine kinase n=1 Tax=Neotamlana sedimentorum TaxID=1435349 RepID=UPI00069A2A7C|nr:sensor histidine kinase [Tamlana sedimentorum]